MSDGTPEATEFDDPLCDWTGHQKPIKSTTMNDGCSRISVAAAELVRKRLGLSGGTPSAYQGRINGAKGVWIVSGPTHSSKTDDKKIWIEISESQEKFKPHDEDTDDDYDINRWTFEVIKATAPVKANTLNIAFIPILEDRGVQHAALQSFIKDIMVSQRRELIACVKDPVALRAWVNRNMVRDSDRINERLGNLDKQWLGGLPFARVDRVMYLLEAGFTPSQLPILGDFVQKMARQHFSTVVSTYQIPLPRSTLVMGIADPTDTLKPGEIHLCLTEPISDESSGQRFSMFNDIEVLVARHPSLRPSDIQKVKAVFYPELAHLNDVVVFPSKGCIPLASKLQGGDYDGDTFWMCWEPALTKDFKNAPSPLPDQIATPEEMGIEVDRRKLGEFMSGPDPVRQFLAEGFKFGLQPELLGWCTNLHKRLAYIENSLRSYGVSSLADLHDLLIDARKNGYIYGLKQYEEYVRRTTKLKKPSIPKQGYEEAVNVGYEDEARSKAVKIPENLVHILDILHFDLVDVEIKACFHELAKFCNLSHTASIDQYLSQPYENERDKADDVIRQELRELEDAFRNIYNNSWNPTLHPTTKGLVTNDRTHGGQDRWSAALQRCYPMYKALQPRNLNHPIINRWMERLGQGPSKWDLIKASTLYAKFPYNEKTPSKSMFAWNMAGEYFMYIKAHEEPGMRPIRPIMLANMKPNKHKVVLDEDDDIEGSLALPPSLADKILNDLTQKDDEGPSDGDEFSSAADFLDLE
jgi:hypothetical protein